MSLIHGLRRSTAGATAVEFALLAPVFITMLFGVIEGSRLFWFRQSLNSVAYATVRCMSISATCNTTTKQQDYAIAKARGYAITIVAANVAITANTTCKSQSGSNQVAITSTFKSALRGFVPLPTTLTATACFPVLS